MKELPPHKLVTIASLSGLKLSFVVTFSGNKAWAAVACTNELGSLLQAWTSGSGITDPLQGEAGAARFAIPCARTFNLTTLLLQSDSQNVVEAILNGTPTGNMDADSILFSLHLDLPAFHKWHIVYVPEVQHFSVHNLAKWAAFCNVTVPVPVSQLPPWILRQPKM